MRKPIFIAAALFSICLLCSCGDDEVKDTGTPYGKNNVSVADIIGSTEELPYESLLDEDMFLLSYESYTDEANPLQLKGGPYKDAAVAKPFKSVLVDEGDIAAPLNIWLYPVVSGDKYIGFINCDMRKLNKDEPVFFGGESFAPMLNEALEKGDIALFNTVDGTYGIYEDNTVITLEADKSYTGTLTFEQAAQSYNLITQSSSKDIIYK